MRAVHRLGLGAAVATLVVGAVAGGAPASGSTAPPGSTEPPASAAPTGSTGSTAQSADELYPPEPLAEATTLTVAVSSRLESFLHLFLADEMGEFAKENIEVEFEIVPTSESTLLLSQGDVDAVPTSMSAGNFNLIADGNAIRGVFPLNGEAEDSQPGFWVREDAIGDDGFQPSDLVGQRVLTPSGPGSYTVGYFWQTVLSAGGVGPNDVAWERISPSDAPLALISGGAPAAMLIPPFWQTVADDGCCVYVDGYPREPISFVAFGPSLLDGDPAVGEAFVRALARTVVTYLQGDYHHADTADVVAELLEQPVEAYQAQPSPVWDPTFPLAISEFDAVQQFFADTEVLSYDTPLTEADIFDPRFVDALGATE